MKKIKEKEWLKLVGRSNFYTLPQIKRDFLIKTAGIFNLGKGFNIRDIYEK